MNREGRRLLLAGASLGVCLGVLNSAGAVRLRDITRREGGRGVTSCPAENSRMQMLRVALVSPFLTVVSSQSGLRSRTPRSIRWYSFLDGPKAEALA